jgi:crossover junction endodeoxyribonuclease RuvC
MRILALDPGYERLGVAVLDREAVGKKEVLVYSECFRTKKELPHEKRLASVRSRIVELIHEYQPDALALEALYISVNQKTAMLVAEARGAILSAAGEHGLQATSINPMSVKAAITGNGRADKTDIHIMVKRLIALPERKQLDDEIDAIAIGLTYFAEHKIQPK